MFNKSDSNKIDQVELISIEQMVPQNHILRKISRVIDFDFIYDIVEDLYCPDNGRPSLDPVILIKLSFIQILFNIKSMRQTIKDVEVNLAYRWFLGLGFHDKVPHFSTFSQNYRRRFKGTDTFDRIFEHILLRAFEENLVDTNIQFVDSTHVKAHANRYKYQKVKISKKAKTYQKQLEKEVDEDREDNGKKKFPPSGPTEEKVEIVQSTNDPESGLFHKGEHKEVFAYNIQTSCDKNGWILGYASYPGNLHDSSTFPEFYEKVIKKYNPSKLVMDAGYKIPYIAKLLIDNEITPVFPYTRQKGRVDSDKPIYKREYVYDINTNTYLCPQGQIIKYSTTDRQGYRHYKSNPKECINCTKLKNCTKNKKCQKVITRHIWQDYLDICENYRLTPQGKEEYRRRKETIERQFGSAKEYHNFRFTNMIGRAKMDMKAALTFACLNMKKLALLKGGIEDNRLKTTSFLLKIAKKIKILFKIETNPRLLLGLSTV